LAKRQQEVPLLFEIRKMLQRGLMICDQEGGAKKAKKQKRLECSMKAAWGRAKKSNSIIQFQSNPARKKTCGEVWGIV